MVSEMKDSSADEKPRGKWLRLGLNTEGVVLVTFSVGIVLVVFYGVLVRYLPISGKQMAWTEEVALLLLVWFTFFGAAAVHREGTHFTMNMLVDRLPLRPRMGIALLVDVLIFAFVMFVIVKAFDLIQSTMGDVSVILRFPRVLIPLGLFVGFCLMLLYCGRNIIASFRGVLGRH
ncbi:MAG: TRAP transporter small permease [Chloroflexota bacterium]